MKALPSWRFPAIRDAIGVRTIFSGVVLSVYVSILNQISSMNSCFFKCKLWCAICESGYGLQIRTSLWVVA